MAEMELMAFTVVPFHRYYSDTSHVEWDLQIQGQQV